MSKNSLSIEIASTEVEYRTCQICNIEFANSRALAGHLKRIHKMNHERYIVDIIFQGNRPKCPECGDETRLIYGKHAFKKYCPKHGSLARIEWSEKFGYGQNGLAGWKKGLTKHDHPGLLSQSIKISGKNNPSFYSREDFDNEIQELIDKRNFHLLIDYEQYKGNFYKYDCKCLQCNSIMSASFNQLKTHGIRCQTCHPSSIEQSEVYNFVRNELPEDIEVLQNSRDYAKFEFDIVVPNRNFIIEYNGLYWHSQKFNSSSSEPRKNLHSQAAPSYHRKKTDKALELGYSLFHIFSDEWRDRRSIVESMIRNRLGTIKDKIYARKCTVVEIPHAQAKQFLIANHLDGYARSSKKLGLFHGDELVCVLTASPSRKFRTKHFDPSKSMEIIRFASKLNTVVVGGFGKLLKVLIAFAKNNDKDFIVTYADMRNGTGSVYAKNGFELIHDSKLSYWYTDNLNRFPREKFRADRQNGLSEWDVAQQAGVTKVFGCGSRLYQLKI